jgi:hypothetical protein
VFALGDGIKFTVPAWIRVSALLIIFWALSLRL